MSTTNAAWVAGSDAPEKEEVKIGFIPLTDCASVVMASVLGFDRKYGIRIVPTREASWAGIRDKLVGGELDAAHVLYGLVYGVELGIGGLQKDMAVLMTLNNNGQGITLSNQLKDKGVTDGASLAALIAGGESRYTFAQTFPTGTHAMWLYYWLASFGIDPLRDIKNIVVPPPQMVSNMALGNMDGCCVGEPWNQRAIIDKVGFGVATSQDVWPDHPEKVLGCTAEFAEKYPNTARAMIMAVLEASRWIDASETNRIKTAETIAGAEFIDIDVELIRGRMLGHYEDGLCNRWVDRKRMSFYGDGAVNFPYLSDGMWFMSQHKRWGMLAQHPDYLAVAGRVSRTDLYAEAAAQVKTPMPKNVMRESKLIDGVLWNGEAPDRYADSFAIHYRPSRLPAVSDADTHADLMSVA